MKIYFDNQDFDLHEFLHHCKQRVSLPNIESWKQSVFQFIIDWHDKSETIEVPTSGSTGKAKIIQLQKKHMRASAESTLNFLKIPEKSMAWLCLPADYIAGKMMIVRALTGNMNLTISKPESKPILPKQHHIALAAMVPMQVEHWTKHPNDITLLEQNITHLLIGGTSISKPLEQKLRVMQGVSIWHTFGMTETITHVALRKLNGTSPWTGFVRLPGVTIEKNRKNCLVIDFPEIGVKQLHSNDLVEISSDGSFTLLGRSDWIINSGGIKLNPEIIELKLDGHLPSPFFITSLSDSFLGEKAILCLENDGDQLSKICEIWKIIESRLEKTEIPREIHFMQMFLRSDTGKLRRKATQFLLKEKLKCL